MEIEDLLPLTGGYGRHERKFLILFLIPVGCIIPWIWFSSFLIMSVPQHWCYVSELQMSNLSIDAQRAVISPPNDPSCSMYNLNYTDLLPKVLLKIPSDTDINYTEKLTKDIFKISNETEVIPCVDGWQYDSENYEQTAASKWNMVCDNNYLPSLMHALKNAGSLVGTPICGLLSDKFGRRILFLFLAGLVVATELAFTLANDIVTFAVVGFIHGSIMPSIFLIPYTLALEVAIPSMRTHISGIYNTCWSVGLSILPLAVYLSRNWTNLCYLIAVLGCLVLCYFRFLLESPRWLISQGKIDDAMNIMMKIAKENGKSSIEAELCIKLQALQERENKKKEEYPNAFNILKSPRLRKHFFLLVICWTTLNLTYGGLTFNMINLNGNEFINFFLMSIVELPGNVVFWYAMEKLGRRWTVSLGFFITGIGCLLPITGIHNSGIASSMIGKFVMTGVFTVSNQQGIELFPTESRSFAVATARSISGVIALLTPFLGYLGMYRKYLPFLVISFMCFIAGVLSSFLPETLNENLPQTILDAEVFGMDQKYFSWIRSESTSKPR